MRARDLILAFLAIAVAPSIQAQPELTGSSEGEHYLVEEVAEGLGIPWGLAFVSRRELLVNQRDGTIQLVDVETGQKRKVHGGPSVYASGQGGLLDVSVPPGYQPGDWIYFTYSKEVNGQGATTLARARLNAGGLEAWEELLVTRSGSNTSRHFGSRIAFDDQGHLFFTVGDRGVRPNGQELGNHAATVLRLTREGETPRDNPFVGREGALPEIWSYGHRNPQGIAFDSANQRLWVIEHGPRGGDEINLVLPGRNYGWPVISYGKEYWGPMDVGEGTHKPGMQQPVKYYVPSIAPGSLLLYSGNAFPRWQGNLFAGALVLRHLNRVVLDDQANAIKEERLLGDLDERIRALVESPEGWIYLSTDSGRLLRMRPAAD